MFMRRPKRIIRSTRVVTPSGVKPAGICIRQGRIIEVRPYGKNQAGEMLIDAGDSVVMPGLVDSHVHVNEPGRTEWEGFATATRAAAAGGVTTLIDMPLNSIPPTTTVEGLRVKREAATSQCWVDVGFWGGAIPGNQLQLEPMLREGVCGFKCFLVHSGVDEFPNVNAEELETAMRELGRLGGTLLAHAELPGPIEAAAAHLPFAPAPGSYARYLHSRPRQAENQAIELLIQLSRSTGCKVHIVHLSSSDAIAALQQAKQVGLPVTAETCAHYLRFAAEEIPPGATEYKCAPPIRERGNRELLWAGLLDGSIDMIVSDHSPCTPDLKRAESGDFMAAWGGISSVQFGLPVVWTEARRRGVSIEQLAKWMCASPARLAGLDRRKGAIAPGFDADLVVWNPEDSFTVTTERIQHRHHVTPYLGCELYGVVEHTLVRGQVVYDCGAFNEEPAGRLLTRDRA